MSAPGKTRGDDGEICAATGCRLRYETLSEGERKAAKARVGGRVVDARMVALEWASEFKVWAQSASAHEVMEMGVRLRDIVGVLN